MNTFMSVCAKFCKFLFATLILFSCKKADLSNSHVIPETKLISTKTVKQITFSGQPDLRNSIVQKSPDKKLQRFLIPLKTGTTTLHKYLLIEQNSVQHLQTRTFLISKKELTQKADLFSIPFSKDGVTAYDIDCKNGTSNKLLLKHKDKELNLNDIIDNANFTNETVSNYAEPSGGYCIDHWWVTYDTETGEIISLVYLGYDCYGCAATNTCTPSGGGGGTPTSEDSAALLLAVSDEYDGVHDGDFYMFTPKTFMVPTYTSSTSPSTNQFNWPIVNADYYKVNCKTTTSYYFVPLRSVHVSECNNNSTLFEMKKTSFFWRVSWQQGSLPQGIIRLNNTPWAEAESTIGGNIHIEARSPWWEFMNSMPTISAESSLIVFYRVPED